jgi:predicted transcriptional regulator YdeE
MSRDDRHFNYIAAIEYEIARTTHDMERYTSAKQRYEQVLRRRNNPPARETQALIYYGMAEIYRDFYLDFTLTAAYFDSSSRQANNPERLPESTLMPI